jgi:hypothetical protein
MVSFSLALSQLSMFLLLLIAQQLLPAGASSSERTNNIANTVAATPYWRSYHDYVKTVDPLEVSTPPVPAPTTFTTAIRGAVIVDPADLPPLDPTQLTTDSQPPLAKRHKKAKPTPTTATATESVNDALTTVHFPSKSDHWFRLYWGIPSKTSNRYVVIASLATTTTTITTPLPPATAEPTTTSSSPQTKAPKMTIPSKITKLFPTTYQTNDPGIVDQPVIALGTAGFRYLTMSTTFTTTATVTVDPGVVGRGEMAATSVASGEKPSPLPTR